jgi:hypothetical protein
LDYHSGSVRVRGFIPWSYTPRGTSDLANSIFSRRSEFDGIVKNIRSSNTTFFVCKYIYIYIYIAGWLSSGSAFLQVVWYMIVPS